MTIQSPAAGSTPGATGAEPSSPAAAPTLNVEALAWVLVLGIAAGWRLLYLDRALPETAEALRARAAWDFAKGGNLSVWPGDGVSALAALLIRLGGDTLAWVRLPSAVFGLLSVAAIALLRPYLGRSLTLAGALLLACSPVAVASSRTLNPDAAGLLCGLLILALALRVSEAGSRRALAVLAAVGGLALGMGGVGIALALVAALHVIIEVAWLDRREVADRWRGLLTGRREVAAVALLFLAGAVLAATRFGAGPSRLSFAAFDDFSPPSPDVGTLLPGHAVVTVLLGYEPVVLVLGLVGAGLLVWRWRTGGPGAVTSGERLLVEWAAAGLLLSVTALHHRPGQLLLPALPLMLLAADLTLRTLPAIAALRWRESLPAVVVAGVLLGYVALRWLDWLANSKDPGVRALLGVAVLLVIAAGLVVWVMFLSPEAMPGVWVAGAWLLGGWVALAGVASVSRYTGDEYLFGRRPDPLRVALLRTIDAALAQGQRVAVERRVAAAMSWELRGRDVRLFSGLPPRSDLAVAPVGSSAASGLTLTGLSAGVEGRWYPSHWDAEGVLRWLVYRTAWGPSEALRAETMMSTNPETEPGGARP